MKKILIDLSMWLTARKANHPALWIAFGAIIGSASVLSLIEGSTLVPVPALYRLLTDLHAPRAEVVTFASEPLLFCGWLICASLFATFSLTIGCVAMSMRMGAKSPRHPYLTGRRR